jgi:hypothetical protein
METDSDEESSTDSDDSNEENSMDSDFFDEESELKSEFSDSKYFIPSSQESILPKLEFLSQVSNSDNNSIVSTITLYSSSSSEDLERIYDFNGDGDCVLDETIELFPILKNNYLNNSDSVQPSTSMGNSNASSRGRGAAKARGRGRPLNCVNFNVKFVFFS